MGKKFKTVLSALPSSNHTIIYPAKTYKSLTPHGVGLWCFRTFDLINR